MLNRFLITMAMSGLWVAGNAYSVEVKGAVTYKMPQGELVSRNVSLDVPPMGQGKVKWISNGKVSESHSFKTKKFNNRVVFEVLFLNPEGAPPNTAMAISGSYLRGTNGVIYYGDVYGRNANEDGNFDDSIESFNVKDESFEMDANRKWMHAGGFMFTTLPY